MIDYLSAGLLLFQQVAFGEDLDVLGNGLPGGVEVVGDGAGGHALQRHQEEDGPAGRVGDGLKYVSAGFHFMQLFDCKIVQLPDCAKFFFRIFKIIFGGNQILTPTQSRCDMLQNGRQNVYIVLHA